MAKTGFDSYEDGLANVASKGLSNATSPASAAFRRAQPPQQPHGRSQGGGPALGPQTGPNSYVDDLVNPDGKGPSHAACANNMDMEAGDNTTQANTYHGEGARGVVKTGFDSYEDDLANVASKGLSNATSPASAAFRRTQQPHGRLQAGGPTLGPRTGANSYVDDKALSLIHI